MMFSFNSDSEHTSMRHRRNMLSPYSILLLLPKYDLMIIHFLLFKLKFKFFSSLSRICHSKSSDIAIYHYTFHFMANSLHGFRKILAFFTVRNELA